MDHPSAGGRGFTFVVIQIAGGRNARDTVVRLDGMVLQGPAESKDWRLAFAER